MTIKREQSSLSNTNQNEISQLSSIYDKQSQCVLHFCLPLPPQTPGEPLASLWLEVFLRVATSGYWSKACSRVIQLRKGLRLLGSIMQMRISTLCSFNKLLLSAHDVLDTVLGMRYDSEPKRAPHLSHLQQQQREIKT